MPCEEVTSVVDHLSLVQMNSNPVIETRLGTSGERRRRLGRFGLETLDSVDVRLLLRLGESAPVADVRENAV